MAISSKRGEYAAWASLVLSVVFFTVTFLIGRWSGFFAVYAASWLIGSAALIWFVLAVQFHQRCLAEQEKLDVSQLAKDKQTATIFQAKVEGAALFAVAQRRLDLLEKWFLPVFSAAIAAYQAGMGLYLLKVVSATAYSEPKQPLLCAVSMTAIAFVCFLMSRYTTGMSAQPQWKPLRAGGSIFIGVAIMCFVLAVSLAFVQFRVLLFVNIIGYAIAGLSVVLGAETALNVILDIYRPRVKGQYSRAAFDSRLLGVINEPGEILHTAAGALDYQFGFKVSQTWFYKLLEKAIVPLLLFATATLYLLSCVVVVSPNEQAVIEHFGNPLNGAGERTVIGPGLTFKWPWPIDIAYKYPTKKVYEINIGFVPRLDAKKQVVQEPLLWGKAHYQQEDLLLVASESSRDGAGAAPVSLVMVAVPVQYRIRDLYSFIYNHNQPEKLLESICYQELTRFAASATIETGDAADSSESLLGAGRSEAKQILTDRIQAAADRAGLGVEVVFLGLQGVHPSPEVAEDYQKVIGAVQKKQAIILDAYTHRNKTLSTLAGSVEDADRLYSLAAEYQRARGQNSQREIEKLEPLLDESFAAARGEIFSTLRQAQSYALERASLARADGGRFASQLKAYQAAKEIYKRQQRLMVFEEALENIRKFVVVADQNDTQIFMVDLQEKLTPSLYELAGFEESSKK
jgi:membrane protease subunit HflK